MAVMYTQASAAQMRRDSHWFERRPCACAQLVASADVLRTTTRAIESALHTPTGRVPQLLGVLARGETGWRGLGDLLRQHVLAESQRRGAETVCAITRCQSYDPCVPRPTILHRHPTSVPDPKPTCRRLAVVRGVRGARQRSRHSLPHKRWRDRFAGRASLPTRGRCKCRTRRASHLFTHTAQTMPFAFKCGRPGSACHATCHMSHTCCYTYYTSSTRRTSHACDAPYGTHVRWRAAGVIIP